jgi:hypothetical protein
VAIDKMCVDTNGGLGHSARRVVRTDARSASGRELGSAHQVGLQRRKRRDEGIDIITRHQHSSIRGDTIPA